MTGRTGGEKPFLAAALLLLALSGVVPAPVPGADVRGGDVSRDVSRTVLGLYNAAESENGEPYDSDIHNFLEKPLNELGMVVEYADVNKPLPDFTRYRAIIVWLSSYVMENPDQFLPWVRDAMRAGVKLILPSGIDIPDRPQEGPGDWALVGEILAGFGLAGTAERLGEKGEPLRMETLRPEFFSHETKIVSEQATYPFYRMIRRDVDVWRRVVSVANPESSSPGVVVGPAGGWAMSAGMLYYSTDVPGSAYRVAWEISPIDFLENALDCAGMPRPDVTTFQGARGAFAHVDVDGAYNMSQPDVPGPSRYALQVAYEEVWRKFPYPTTLGLIAVDYDPELDLHFIHDGETIEDALNNPLLPWERPHREVATELRGILAEIAELPWIQYGCHGYTHPLFWRKLTPSYAIPKYTATYESELRGAVDYLNAHVLPPGRKVELFQWTGDCNPPEEALDILADMGLANINGGDPLYDARFASLYYVCGLSVPRGKRRQIYTAGSNENIYTENWLGYKGAFNHVIQTFERAESPRRLLPVNIYYHTFPVERLAGYLAIQHAYEWAAKQELCWIRTREYADAAQDFFSVRIGRLDGGGWRIGDYGNCRTIRFDREARVVDMKASAGVSGYVHHNGALYVSLLPGAEADIRFAKGDAAPEAPCLARATGMLERIESGPLFWRADVVQWGPGFVELWAPGGEWKYRIEHPDGAREEGWAQRLADGRVRCPLADAGGRLMRVRFEK